MAREENRIRYLRMAHGFAVACTGLTLLMIMVGAMVTTIRAGDADPTWSLAFWDWFIRWYQNSGHLAFELGHRAIGTVIGFLAMGFMVTLWLAERGRPARWLGLAALGILVAQGVLGGVRVLVVFDPQVQSAIMNATGGEGTVEARRAGLAMAHGVLAQITLCVFGALALVTSHRWRNAPAPVNSARAEGTHKFTQLAIFFVLFQLTLGTLVRQTGAGVLYHVLGAVVVTCTLVALSARLLRRHGGIRPIRRTARLLLALLVVQISLGVIPWMLSNGALDTPPPASLRAVLRSLHVTCGALILMVCLSQSLWTKRLLHASGAQIRGRVYDYLVLSKARLSLLVLVSVATGFFLAVEGAVDLGLLVAALVGVGLVAAGTSAGNQILERERDGRMARTADRPLPAGRMSVRHALVFALVTCIGGFALLWWQVNALTALLSAATCLIYLFIYTPLKLLTTFNTLVGAIPGALPPVMGWTAVTGSISVEPVVLFAILFVWQLPHFWSIAWLYRSDYQRAGMRMLSVVDRDGGMLARQIALWCLALMVTSLLPVMVGMAGRTYGVVALLLGAAFLSAGLLHAVVRTRRSVRGVFFASLLYLPLLLATLLIDRL